LLPQTDARLVSKLTQSSPYGAPAINTESSSSSSSSSSSALGDGPKQCSLATGAEAAAKRAAAQIHKQKLAAKGKVTQADKVQQGNRVENI